MQQDKTTIPTTSKDLLYLQRKEKELQIILKKLILVSAFFMMFVCATVFFSWKLALVLVLFQFVQALNYSILQNLK